MWQFFLLLLLLCWKLFIDRVYLIFFSDFRNKIVTAKKKEFFLCSIIYVCHFFWGIQFLGEYWIEKKRPLYLFHMNRFFQMDFHSIHTCNNNNNNQRQKLQVLDNNQQKHKQTAKGMMIKRNYHIFVGNNNRMMMAMTTTSMLHTCCYIIFIGKLFIYFSSFHNAFNYSCDDRTKIIMEKNRNLFSIVSSYIFEIILFFQFTLNVSSSLKIFSTHEFDWMSSKSTIDWIFFYFVLFCFTITPFYIEKKCY